jgi:hypothetical protein
MFGLKMMRTPPRVESLFYCSPKKGAALFGQQSHFFLGGRGTA